MNRRQDSFDHSHSKAATEVRFPPSGLSRNSVLHYHSGKRLEFLIANVNLPSVDRSRQSDIKKELNESWISIIDASPGTSCPVVESIKGCDYVLLVTEPTPFGLNDLELAVNMVRELDLPFGVVINRSDMGDNRTVEYCRNENIQVLLTIPDSRRIAEGYSRGDNLLKSAAFLRPRLLDMFEKITSGVRV